jgi:hypothetical protein
VLQGTFETLTLTEVLGLLARSTKRGALLLEAGPATGVLHVTDGRCFAAESSEQRGAVEHAPELLVRLVDVCFAVARHEGGSFRFVADEQPDWSCSEPVDLEVAIEELDRLLEEWHHIQEVIPSLEYRVRLSDELAVDELPVDRERWKLLVAIDGRRTVRDLVQRTSRPVLDVCHALMALADAGAVGIVEPPASASRGSNSRKKAEAAPPVPAAIVQPEEPYGPGVETAHPGPIAATGEPVTAPAESAAATADDDSTEPTDGADKGEFLRVFSALRDG